MSQVKEESIMEEGHVIKAVLPGSIGEELELEPGDRILAVNNQTIEDVFDYQYLIDDEYIELTVKKSGGEEWILEIEKDAEEDLGIEFESSLMDDYHSCSNKMCIRDRGDTVRVSAKVKEGNRERIQVFEGTVIKRQNGSSRETFTVRKSSNGVGVEKTWPLHSPIVEKIEVVRRGKVRRAKLFYLRDRVGKRAKVKELVK